MKEIDPDAVFHKINSAGHAWVGLNAKARLLEDCEKSELSQIIQENIKNGAKSMAAAESEARADQRTFDYICNKTNARQAADEAKVTYEAAKVWWEAQRTLAATLRQEIKMTN